MCAIDISSRISVLADYFVICQWEQRQPKVKPWLTTWRKDAQGRVCPSRKDEIAALELLLDMAILSSHVFDRENREFYNLERIWSDGRRFGDIKDL
ncbi:MAG: RsfS/YbeB/iojap family protein [[Clostridium] scindens]